MRGIRLRNIPYSALVSVVSQKETVLLCLFHRRCALKWRHWPSVKCVENRFQDKWRMHQRSRGVWILFGTPNITFWLYLLHESFAVFLLLKLVANKEKHGKKSWATGWLSFRGRKRTRCDLIQHPLHFTTAAILPIRETRSGHMSLHSHYGNDKCTDDSMWHMEIQQTDCWHTHSENTHSYTYRHTDTHRFSDALLDIITLDNTQQKQHWGICTKIQIHTELKNN